MIFKVKREDWNMRYVTAYSELGAIRSALIQSKYDRDKKIWEVYDESGDVISRFQKGERIVERVYPDV